LAHKLNVREEWLKNGQEPMQADTETRIIESSVQTGSVDVFLSEDYYSSSKIPIQSIQCNLPKIGELFGILLETEAMSPRFPKGCLVIFDDKKEAQDGDFILTSYDNYPAPIFRQLLVVGSTNYLNALNPKFERLFLTSDCKIFGTMIQAIISFV
jgi:hypothetical protein